MSVELRITFEGDAPGLNGHRLSLGAFAKALDRLLVALRRTASAVVTGGPVASLGRIADDARALDLELVDLEHNCVSLRFDCVSKDGEERTLSKLATEAITRLVNDIQAECVGELRNAAVRRYVQTLPAGVTSQRYLLTKDGVTISDVVCGAAPHVEETEAPRLLQIRGQVTGVNFPPAVMSVWIKSGDKTLKLAADEPTLDAALKLRGQFVAAAIMVDGEGPNRALWIRSQESLATRQPSVEQTTQLARERWLETLNLLAQ